MVAYDLRMGYSLFKDYGTYMVYVMFMVTT